MRWVVVAAPFRIAMDDAVGGRNQEMAAAMSGGSVERNWIRGHIEQIVHGVLLDIGQKHGGRGVNHVGGSGGASGTTLAGRRELSVG